ncbi:MAG: HipA domain-containing protein [Oscillospiraceae bacterium]|nr:HipA domain-containing protein [Oscillospiraceae bacterium]
MEYTLMHKHIPAADFQADEYGYISSVERIYAPEHLPIGTFKRDKADIRELNSWWRGRSVPASRKGLDHLLERTDMSSFMSVVLKGWGLSLSDHYWAKPKDANINWEDVNFFDNPFSDDIGNLLFGEDVPEGIDFFSPDNTSDGWLRKRWKISEGRRVLFKGGSDPFQQEPFNEVIAAHLMESLGVECVHYDVVWQNGLPYSTCADFVTTDTELVSAARLMAMRKKSNNENSYQHFVACCADVGLDAVPFLDRLLTIDYIIANEDRHFNNFGVLRDPETLEFTGFAPIYDSGSSLCYNRNAPRFYEYEAKPFYSDAERQFRLVSDLKWFSPERAYGIIPDIKSTLKVCADMEFIPFSRIEQLCGYVETRIGYAKTRMQGNG